MKHLISAACLLLISLSATAFDRSEAYKTISIEGQHIPEALGLDLSSLSVSAIFDGEMEPIPYQIDEYNVGGAVFFSDWDMDIAGTQGKLDTSDQLLFITWNYRC